MDKFLEIITTLKIPTLALIGMIFYTGYSLISNSVFISPSGIGGAVLLCVGIILSLIIFVDYRYKEQSEHIIKQQGRAIDNLSKALKSTSETHSKFEKNAQETLNSPEATKIGKKSRREYSIEGADQTLTQ